MLNGKQVGLETIVERVHRDTGFIVDVDWIDIAEWVGDALGLIDAPMQYRERITDNIDAPKIEITDKRGELPCDLVRIIQTRTCDGKPMRYSTDSFHRSMHVDNCKDLTCSSDLTYKVNNNYIFTNFNSGEVEMAYLAYPTDEKGFPTVPADEVFQQAVTAYVAERIGQRLYLRDKISRDKFHHLQQERTWYIGKAQTKPLIPNRDKTESIKNQFRKLVDFARNHRTGYKETSVEQVIRNHSRYRG